MKRLILILFIILQAIMGFSGPSKESKPESLNQGRIYTIRLACASEYRAKAVVDASEILNARLKADGIKDSVIVEYIPIEDLHESREQWEDNKDYPELICTTIASMQEMHAKGQLVDASYIMDDFMYSMRVPQNLRDLAKTDLGEYNSVLMDTECRVVTIFKPALLALGWTEEQIEAWKQDARDGNLTLKEFQDLAKEIVDKGICDYGFLITASRNSDWRYIYVNWCHGKIPATEDGKIIVDRSTVIDFYSFYRDSVKMGLIPADWLYNYRTVEAYMALGTGRCFSFMGNIEIKARIRSTCNLTSRYVDENFFTIPYPVPDEEDTPVSGCNPYMIGLSPSSQANPELSKYCRMLLDCLLDNEIQLDLSVRKTHLAISKDTMDSYEYKTDGFISEVSFISENNYLFVMPAYSDMSNFTSSQEFYDGVRESMLTAFDESISVEEIADKAIAKILKNQGEGNYVIVE